MGKPVDEARSYRGFCRARVVARQRRVANFYPGIPAGSENSSGTDRLPITGDTFTPTDYRSLNYDLAASPAQFNSYYTFSSAYSLPGPMAASLAQLYPELATNVAKQALYRGQFDSGNQSLKPGTTTTWNFITYANWPVFRCGIGNALQQDFTNCVNSH